MEHSIDDDHPPQLTAESYDRCGSDINTSATSGMEHFSHDHPLLEHEFRGKQHEGSISCTGCGGSVCKQHIYEPRFVYKCFNGDVEERMHTNCALLKPSLNHPYHKHPLVLVNRDIQYLDRCAACGAQFQPESGGNDLYFCQQCDDMFHKECLDMPPVKRVDRHPHNLTLYLDPIPENFDGGRYYCDACEQMRNYFAFSYACKECNFICQTRCDHYNKVQEIEGEKAERDCEMFVAKEERKLGNIQERIELLEQELRKALSEKSYCQHTLETLRKTRDRIKAIRRRDYSTTSS